MSGVVKIKSTMVYTLVGVLPLAFSFVFTPVYAHYLSPEEYGILNFFTLLAGIMIPLMGLGVDQSVGYLYWDHKKDPAQLKVFMSTSLSLVLVIASAFVLLGMAIGPYVLPSLFEEGEVFAQWPYLFLCLLFAGFMVLNRIFVYYFRNEGDLLHFSLLNILTLLLITAGSIYGVVLINGGAEAAVEGRTIGFCAVVLVYMVFLFRRWGTGFNAGYSRDLIRISLPLFISSLVGAFAYAADRFIIEENGGFHWLGIYGFALTIASLIEILLNATANVYVPTMYESILNEKKEEYALISKQVEFMSWLIHLAVVLLILVLDPVLDLLIPPSYHQAKVLVPVLAISFLPRIYTTFFTLILYKHKKTIMVLWSNLFYLSVSFSLGYLAYMYYDMKGMIYAVFISAILNASLMFLISTRMDVFRFDLLRPLLLTILILSVVILSDLFLLSQIDRLLVNVLPLAVFVIFSVLGGWPKALSAKRTT